MLRLKISKNALDKTYAWFAEVWLTGHDQPIYKSKHRTCSKAQQCGLAQLRKLEAETRRGAFDWEFFAGDNTPRAWGWLTCTARTAYPEKGYSPGLSKIIRATAGLPVQLGWNHAQVEYSRGELTIRVPFKTAWGSSFTERKIREADRLVHVDWVETDWLTSITGEHAEELAQDVFRDEQENDR